MTARQLLVAGAAVLTAAFSGSAAAQPAAEQYVQVAHIEIDPVQLEEYRAAVREQITGGDPRRTWRARALRGVR